MNTKKLKRIAVTAPLVIAALSLSYSTLSAATTSPAAVTESSDYVVPEEGTIAFHGPRVLGPETLDPYVRVKKSTDTLGLPENYSGRSSWTYRTARQFFIGWSTVEPDQFTGAADQPLYRDGTLVSTVLKEQKKDAVDLYAIYVSQSDATSLLDELSGKVNLNHELTEAESTPGSTLFKEATDTYTAENDKRNVVIRFEENKQQYNVALASRFTFDNKKVAGVVAENPLSVIKEAVASSTYNGANPDGYTHVDLEVEIDSRATTATRMNNVTLKSGLFMIKAVLDENYNVLYEVPASELPVNGSKVQTFSFDNPNQLNKFIFRTTIRDYNQEYKPGENNPHSAILTDEKSIFDMELISGDASNVTISKDEAAKLVNKNESFVFNGRIRGEMEGAIPIFGSFTFPVIAPVNEVPSANTVNVSFKKAYAVIYKYVDYDNLPAEVKATLPAEMTELNGLDIAKGMDVIAPTINKVTTLDGEWIFKGWDAATKVADDTTLVDDKVVFTGSWEFVAKPDQPNPDKPGQPDQPNPDKPGQPDQPNPDKPGQPDQPNPDKPGQSEQPKPKLPSTGVQSSSVLAGVVLTSAGLGLGLIKKASKEDNE